VSFKDPFGITKIRASDRDNLNISWDFDTNPKKNYPVLLYTPDMRDTDNHYHIALSEKQARELRDWLTAFLRSKR
jgi:hypothetical protein